MWMKILISIKYARITSRKKERVETLITLPNWLDLQSWEKFLR